MIQVNIHEAKTHLSRFARMVKKGQTVILCDRNKPFAEIRPLTVDAAGRRPLGLGRGLIDVPNDFNDPDLEIEAMFYGD